MLKSIKQLLSRLAIAIGVSNHFFSCVNHFWEKWEKFNYKLVKNILTENKEIGLHQLD